jgi:HSP20 family protein
MAILQWKRTSSPEVASELDSQNLWERFQEDWDRVFGWSRYPEASGLFDRSVAPSLDAIETEHDVTLWADMPGLERKDLDLSVAGNVLTLKGEKKNPAKGGKDKERVYRDETWTGSFHRSVSLPDSVDTSQISAEFRDGVLKVVIGKKPELKPRQITVSAR